MNRAASGIADNVSRAWVYDQIAIHMGSNISVVHDFG